MDVKLWVSNVSAFILTVLPCRYLGGLGDMTGRYTAQPPATGEWSLIHDTNYPGAPPALQHVVCLDASAYV